MFLHGPAAEAEARSLIAKNGCGMSKNYWMNRRSASTFITIAYLCMLPRLIMDGVSVLKVTVRQTPASYPKWSLCLDSCTM